MAKMKLFEGMYYTPAKVPNVFKNTEYHHLDHVWDRFRKTKAYKTSTYKSMFPEFFKWVQKEYRFEKK